MTMITTEENYNDGYHQTNDNTIVADMELGHQEKQETTPSNNIIEMEGTNDKMEGKANDEVTPGPSRVVLKDLSDYFDEDEDNSQSNNNHQNAAHNEIFTDAETATNKSDIEHNMDTKDDFDPDDQINITSEEGEPSVKESSMTVATVSTREHLFTASGNSARTFDSAHLYSTYSRYENYVLDVDPKNDDKAIEVLLCNFSRPHMRAFHFSWMCFFVAFFIWFAIAPLLGEIRLTLGLTNQEIWLSNIASIGGTIVLRFMNGAQCDKYGARLLMGWTLILVSIPTACTGFVNSATGLIVLRFFIGFAGSTFVMCQFWTSRMFTKEVAGTANALVAGWGNLGGGVTQLIMGSVLFPLFKTGMSAEMAWRTVSLVPAVVAIIMGILCICFTDDAPKGNYMELKKHGVMSPNISATVSFKDGAKNINTWMLFVQYATCFGVELTMNNASALYFIDVFEMSTEQAGAIASLFGWMNLFARAVGGYVSDFANLRSGMRGQLWVQTILLLFEGLLVIAFSHTRNLVLAIIILVCFSMFVQACEGSTYGILPYVNPPVTGSIAGIVGAGGNVGAVVFGVLFHQLPYYWAFDIMGGLIILSCFFSLGIRIPGLAGLVCGEDCPQAILDRTPRL